MALQTVESKKFQQITIHLYATAFEDELEETVYRGWEVLDHLLVQFRTSRSIRPKVTYEVSAGDGLEDCASILLPELTRIECLH